MELGTLIVATAALTISLLSYYFSRKSWQESNRPLVTARVTAFDGGQLGTALNILVENTGNRPARNVELILEAKNLAALLKAEQDDPLRKAIERVFSRRGIIPILANGKFVINDFGWLSADEKSTWKGDLRFTIQIAYEDLDGRKYTHANPLLLADDKGFAGGFWSDEKR